MLIGGGKIDIPDKESILDLGFVDKQDKYDAYGAAEFFCNPSEMESFSLVVMESWLAGRPVLVNGKCAVTKDFARRVGGGLWFDNYAEFEGCIRWFMQHKGAAKQMGQKGRQYVMEHYSWDVIVKTYMEYFEGIDG